ncbi:EcoAI/FtnUII family type I restriction enzme subunit R [Halothiobacillus neapolitanus]|uniref:Type I site-specific deoxyribonuclease n=1 Tax=Halothiobacillus neapolitanus (strain ATCC 23641 / DSM 15147 / CIP 104769 / NCIMB 8539 / c2) TaxID=555778 RepID=D0KYE6_HALNC|nr:type I restriction endonuclease subunit R [Halothiobacillus neapolitanus]ACX95469.1 Type I site-specific deoxyribonuclease [Halothiobacillus neapolitanus c2]TDN65766.1 type I restriction enzyme R subunit [Halothiobacillus neapolitanus]
MNEAETRAEHIDPALAAAGWGVVAGSRIRREYPITLGRIEGAGKRGKALTADYVLEYRNTKLAVVEAKAWNKPLTEGVGQAKDYSGKLAIRFAYATNGQGIYGIDMESGVEAELANYPSPDELWARTFASQNIWRDRFAEVPFEDRGGYFQSRYYQDIAIERVLAAIADHQSRILLTLATGTGKTFIAFQLAWKLFHSRWNLRDWQREAEPSRRPRILFLADRNILANQAFNAFSAFPEDALVRIDPADIRKQGRVPKNGSLFFTIFQTFMSGQDAEGQPAPYFGDYPPDFFDCIIIDECHRGGANDESNWRGILAYFAPAVQLGLTATPKRKDNVDTYQYFGEPVFVYSLKDGINDGFLTPFRVKQIATTLDEYVYTPDDTLVEGEIEAGKRYEEADFNKIIEIKEREQKRVEIFMAQIDQREKTIVFCATQEHALAVRDLINQIKSSSNPDYCQRVTANDGARGEHYLRDFQDNEKTIPTILTTSQKLSTGVDARNVRNIVLMRPVNSMIEFKQIIGRGTRLYDGKDYFTIYDFVKAHHHFNDPEWDGEPLEPEPTDPRPPQPPSEPTPPDGVREPSSSYERKPKVKVQLSDGKARTIQHMMSTSFWHPDGTPMSAQQFMESLFGRLPEFFKDEDELRALWSDPETRKRLLEGLAEKGFGTDQLREMQKIIDAQNSDLFDVLAYVAYAQTPLSREDRADRAMALISSHFNSKQQVFLDFVLSQYISVGVEELDKTKLGSLLRLKYHDSINDAIADLGKPDEIGQMFSGFQKFLYQPVQAKV